LSREQHWEALYQKKATDEVSWYRPQLDRSLQFIEAAKLDPGAPILDVGGGASTLVDDLLARGYGNVTVLDPRAGIRLLLLPLAGLSAALRAQDHAAPARRGIERRLELARFEAIHHTLDQREVHSAHDLA